jgi:hypothetical protein
MAKKTKTVRPFENIGAKSESSQIFKYLMVSTILISVLLLALIFQKPPEKYSEVNLIEKTLPSQIEAGTKFTFGFEIYNHEGKGRIYTYSIKVDGKEMANKKIVVENKAQKEIYEALAITEKGGHKIVIDIDLENEKKYSLFFHIDAI